MSRIVIFGGQGQLGSDCREVLGGRHEVIPLDIGDLDVSDRVQCRAVLDRYRPAIVVNGAAFTNVDRCETERDAAWKVNAEAPGFMAEWTERHGAYLVHISTDYVFDGRQPVPESYVEEDAPAPLSEYGRSKLAGEQAVAARTARYAILRTAWLYGIRGRNFPKTMLRMAIEQPGRELRVVRDQFGSATWSRRLAEQVARAIDEDARGLFHATAEGYGSWFDVARLFLSEMGVPHRIVPCAAAEFPRPAARPSNSILENRRLKERGWNVMRDWREDLAEFAGLFKTRLLEEARTPAGRGGA